MAAPFAAKFLDSRPRLGSRSVAVTSAPSLARTMPVRIHRMHMRVGHIRVEHLHVHVGLQLQACFSAHIQQGDGTLTN